jgi:hypothetical protein
MISNTAIAKVRLVGNSSRGVAETIGCATNPQPLGLLGFERCENVLRYVGAWRQVCAMAPMGSNAK